MYRRCAALFLLTFSAACRGGGGGDTSAPEGRDLVSVSDLLLAPGDSGYGMLMPDAQPRGTVTMSGAFGGRIGGTDEAVLGVAKMQADFDAARVQGTVSNLGLYDVELHLPINDSTPKLTESLTGHLVFEGGIEMMPSVGEGIWFEAGYAGTLTGPTSTLAIVVRTERGAFLVFDAGMAAYGTVDGTLTLRRGGQAFNFDLREGRIFVRE